LSEAKGAHSGVEGWLTAAPTVAEAIKQNQPVVKVGDPVYAERSAIRYRRAAELLAAHPDGGVTEDGIREILSDHEHAPDSLCRHETSDHDGSVTCFWCIADVTDMRITFGRGNPCDSVAQEYVFSG